jgi:hypothetical protein
MMTSLPIITIAEGTEHESRVIDARAVALWSERSGPNRDGPPRTIWWHHTVYTVRDIPPDDQLVWLQNTISSGTYGWPYNFLVWPGDPSPIIWYLNDVDESHPHTYRHNSDVAIAAHGNYERDDVPDNVIDAMWTLSHALMAMWDVTIPVRPHCETYPTKCPGRHIRARLHDLVTVTSPPVT